MQSTSARADPPTEPLRLGALDVGSNAIRYLIAEFHRPNRFVPLETFRFPVRLGEGVFSDGNVTGPAMDQAVAAAGHFRARMADLGAAQYRAVATSAVRESRNADALLGRIRRETGIELEPISGIEEATLVFTAVSRTVHLAGSWLLADLGGGSLELTAARDGAQLSRATYPIGAVRLLQSIPDRNGPPEEVRRALDERIRQLALPPELNHSSYDGMVLTGGSAEAIADLGPPRPVVQPVLWIPRDRIRQAAEQLAGMSPAERMTHFGLRADRADVILPAALIFDWLADRTRAHEIAVPHVGVKEGIVYRLIDQLHSDNPPARNSR